MPSPSCSTVPTSARFVSTSNSSIRWRRIDVISSGRSFTLSAPCRGELLAESFEPAAHARVEPHRSGLEDNASDQVRVDRPGGLHLAAGGLLDAADDPTELGVVQLVSGRQLDVEDPLLLGDEGLELVGDLPDLAGAALL